MFNDLVIAAQQYFPKLQIKYKNNSFIMKALSIIMFFNKGFMSNYVNTFGSSIYYPSQQYIIDNPIDSEIVFLHELVHMYDVKNKGIVSYSLLYGFPQILFVFCLPLFFFSWKIALILSILFLLPLPAYFRMEFEKRAYLCSLYALSVYGKKNNLSDADVQNMLDLNKDSFCKQFNGPSYYYMWIFSSVKSDFDKGVNLIKAGKRPYDDAVFDMIDNLLSKT